MDGDLGLVGGRPLEEQAEGDVVAVRRELPEQRGPVFVGRDSNRDRLAVANLSEKQMGEIEQPWPTFIHRSVD